jgi:hypothetical protein
VGEWSWERIIRQGPTERAEREKASRIPAGTGGEARGCRAGEDVENRDDKDREIHALLYRQTASAREVMEEALAALVKHERIQL